MPITARYYLFQKEGDDAPDELGGGAVKVAARIGPDLCIGETAPELPLSRMIQSLAESPDSAGLIGELLPEPKARPDGLSVLTAVALPLAAIIFIWMRGLRADFHVFFLLLLAAPIVLLSGIAALNQAARSARYGALDPILFHFGGSVAAFAFGVSLMLREIEDPGPGLYFFYSLILAALPVLYRLGPALSGTVFFRGIVPSGLPAYLTVEDDEGNLSQVPTYSVEEGMTVVLSQGIVSPVECTVISGECEMDYLGIPDTRTLRAGDVLHAGAQVRSGEVKAEVVHVPDFRLIEESTRLRVAAEEPFPFGPFLNLMSALAVLVVTAAAVFSVKVAAVPESLGKALVDALVIAGALPLEAMSLLGRYSSTILKDLAASRGFSLSNDVTAGEMASLDAVHCSAEDAPDDPPAAVTVHTDGSPAPGEAIITSRPEDTEDLPKTTMVIFKGAREAAPRNAAVLLTGRAGEFWSFLAGARRSRRATYLALVFSIVIGSAASMIASVGMIPPYLALVIGALGVLWAEVIHAGAAIEHR